MDVLAAILCDVLRGITHTVDPGADYEQYFWVDLNFSSPVLVHTWDSCVCHQACSL